MPQSTCEFGRFSLNLDEQQLLRDGQPVPLTPRVFALLRVLVGNAGHLIEKERLLKEVWNDAFVEEANLNRAISVLRKALGETPAERYIETVPKRGYRFVASVREPASQPAVHVENRRDSAVARATDVRIRWPAGHHRRFGVAMAVAATILIVGTAAYLARTRRAETDRLIAAGPVHRQLTFTGKEITPTLSPDSARIAYVSTESPHRKVMVQELHAGQPVVVFSAPEAGGLRWSPDSSELMFWARGEGTDGVYIAPRSGGRVRRVAAGWPVNCWSPDGATIALALFGPQKIRLINRLGEEQGTISLQGSRDWIWDLDWSSVHGRLLFVATDDQRRAAIWSIRPDGTGQTKILSTDTEISAARWAPAGDAVYYFSRVNQTVSVFKAPVATNFVAEGPTGPPLVSGLEADGSFGLSADATRLVYARAPYYSNLWLLEADSTSATPARTTQLTHGTSIIERPRVSPDGKSIVFNMGYESRANLYTMPASGGSATQLTFLSAFSVAGVWSPDGKSVGFVSTEGGQPRVWVVRADGTSPHPLPSADMSENFNLAWAPGARLLYQKTDYGNFYTIDPTTQQRRLLLTDDSRGVVSSPEYSPDGKRLVLFSSGPGGRGLKTIDGETLREAFIHELPAVSDSNPLPIGWSPDGTAVYAYDGKRAADRGRSVIFRETVTDGRILRVPLNGGPPTTVVDLPFEEVGGVAMFPDARRFLVSVYSSRSDVWVVDNFDATPPSAIAGRAK